MQTEYVAQPATHSLRPAPQAGGHRAQSFNPFLAQTTTGDHNSHKNRGTSTASHASNDNPRTVCVCTGLTNRPLQAGRGRTMSVTQPYRFPQPGTSGPAGQRRFAPPTSGAPTPQRYCYRHAAQPTTSQKQAAGKTYTHNHADDDDDDEGMTDTSTCTASECTCT